MSVRTTYHFCYLWEAEAREFHYVSQPKDGAERVVFLMVEALFDVSAVHAFNQVAPEIRDKANE